MKLLCKHLLLVQTFVIVSLKVAVGQGGELGFTSFGSFLSSLYGPFYKTPPVQATMSTLQMIEYNGYSVEEHKVKTQDGYILTMFRIPSGKVSYKNKNKNIKKRRPVILQHGDFCSSNDWLLLPSNKALPYFLADNRHDVWLGNARGNNYSMGHVRLSPTDSQFWDFSYDELADYDIPAIINYVLNVTQYDKLNWVGHSAGTGTFFIAMSEHPELNEKVNKMVALSPSFSIAHSRFRLETLIPPQILQPFFGVVNGGRVISSRILDVFRRLAPPICSASIPRYFCNNMIFLVGGYNPSQVTPETASLILGHTPSETSGKLVIQMGQSVKFGRLKRFDYGSNGNRERYGSSISPNFNLSRVTVPIQAWYGLNDVRNHPMDAQKTVSELGNVIEFNKVADTMWTHLDFMYGKDAKSLIYDRVKQFLEE